MWVTVFWLMKNAEFFDGQPAEASGSPGPQTQSSTVEVLQDEIHKGTIKKTMRGCQGNYVLSSKAKKGRSQIEQLASSFQGNKLQRARQDHLTGVLPYTAQDFGTHPLTEEVIHSYLANFNNYILLYLVSKELTFVCILHQEENSCS